MIVEVRQARLQDRPAVESMLAQYLREMAALEGHERPEDYPYLPLYWKEAGRFPFLLMVDSDLAGFALVRRVDDESGQHFQMAEFFVIPRQRRKGVGRRAAVEIFSRFPGRWRVRQLESNRGARAFWRRVIGSYGAAGFEEIDIQDGSIQEFWSGPPGEDTRG